MYRQFTSASNRVVVRLRLAFACIALTLTLAAVIGGYQLTLLVNSQKNAIEHAVPSLVAADQLQSELAELLALTERLRIADSAATVADFEKRIRQLFVTLRSTVKRKVDMPTAGMSASRMNESVIQLEKLLSRMVPLKLEQIGGLTRSTRQREMLIDLRTRFLDAIEPRLIDAAFQLEDALDQSVSLSRPLGESITSQVDLQVELSEIRFQMTATTDLAAQMSLGTGALLSAENLGNLQFRLNSVTQILASLENDAFRRQLAQVLKQLHALILEGDGIVTAVKAHNTRRASLNDLFKNQIDIVQELSRTTMTIVALADSGIATSSQQFRDALYRTLVLLVVAGVLVALVIGWVSYRVVERQIGRRMSRLTAAVMDIAAGDTAREVMVKGTDEIGMMASALEVFKDNARMLREANVEMEQFAYAAAHDLRSPLRAIESLAQWTLEDGEDLPEDCVDNLQKIVQRAQRLSSLQNDLLNYSRAGHSEETLELVDLSVMVDELSDLLDPDDRFSIELVDHIPSVYTFVTPLRQVILNLVTNAIKHHDADHGRIEILAVLSDDRLVLSVRDDGAGIEPRFQARIFELFKTLKSSDTVEGSGLGLALIQKLVARYGGQVRVQSDPAVARGATFSFDWPVQSAARRQPADPETQMPR